MIHRSKTLILVNGSYSTTNGGSRDTVSSPQHVTLYEELFIFPPGGFSLCVSGYLLYKAVVGP